jgi:hypothetical protein
MWQRCVLNPIPCRLEVTLMAAADRQREAMAREIIAGVHRRDVGGHSPGGRAVGRISRRNESSEKS